MPDYPSGAQPVSEADLSQALQQKISRKAQQWGVNPGVALRVERSEGPDSSLDRMQGGDYGTSGGPFQLHRGGPGSVGTDYERATGNSVFDPNKIDPYLDYTFNRVRNEGWGAWSGARRQGIYGKKGVGPLEYPKGAIPVDAPNQYPKGAVPTEAPPPKSATTAAGPIPNDPRFEALKKQQPSPNEQLRRDLHLPTRGEVRAEPFAEDKEIAARTKLLPPETTQAMLRRIASDPNGAWSVRAAAYLGSMGIDVAKDIANLPQLAHQVGKETAANTVTSGPAKSVADLAMLFSPAEKWGDVAKVAMAPKIAPEAPKIAPEAPKIAPEAPKIAPETPKPPPPYIPLPEKAPPPPLKREPRVARVFTKKPLPLEKAQQYLDALADAFGVARLPVKHLPEDGRKVRGALKTSTGRLTEEEVNNFKRLGIDIPREEVKPLEYYINKMLSAPYQAWTLAHEFGHHLQYTKLLEAPEEVRNAIVEAFYRDRQAGIQVDPIHAEANRQQIGEAKVTTKARGYENEFGEWFANQAAQWLTTNKPAVTLAEKFFKGVAAAWKRLYEKVAGRQATAPEIDAFMRKHFNEQSIGREGGFGGDRVLSAARASHLDAAVLASRPPRPPRDWIKTLEGTFQKIRGSSTADREAVSNWLKGLPKEARDPATLKKLFRFGEGDPTARVTPQEQQIWTQYIEPMRNENRKLYNALKKAGIADDSLDPEYMHRAVKGFTREFDPYTGAGTAENPPAGFKKATPDSAKDRLYYAIEDGTGNRKLVKINAQGGMYEVAGGKHTKLTPDSVLNKKGYPVPPDLKPGNRITIGGKDWTVRNSFAREVETHTNVRYYQNALASIIRNNLQLKAATRLTEAVKALKQDPEFARWTKPVTAKDIPHGWVIPDMPMFRDTWMHPHLAGAIDDFWGKFPKSQLVEALYKVTRFAVQSMFWSPIVHASNAAAHWFTARGFDWVNPVGYYRLGTTGLQAIHEVITQGNVYQDLLRRGSGLIYGGIAQRNFFEHVLKAVGENVVKNPSWWDPIAKIFGWGPSDLAKAIYAGSARALWGSSDIMMVQRVLELERKGMTREKAIAEAEKHLPNYQIPTTVMGSRALAEVLRNMGLTEFSRYHYSMFKSVAHMIKDTLSPSATMHDRIEAIGSAIATAVLIFGVQPYITRKIQQATGDKNLEYSPKGSTVIPQTVMEVAQGKVDPFAALNRFITINPVIQTGMEILKNRDFFTGHEIAPAKDFTQHPLRAATRMAEHAAGGVVSPLGTLERGLKNPKGVSEEIFKQIVGARKPPQIYESRAEKNYERKRTPGLIEQQEMRLENWVRTKMKSYAYRGAQ